MESLRSRITLAAILFLFGVGLEISGIESLALALVVWGLTCLAGVFIVWPWIKRIRVGFAPPNKELQEAEHVEGALLNQMAEVRTELAEVKRANTRYEKENERLHNVSDGKSKGISDLQERVAEAKREISRLVQENISLEKHKSDLQKLLDDENKKVGVLQRDLDQATEDRAFLQDENRTLKERVQKLDEDLKMEDEVFHDLRDEKTRLASSLQEANSYGANLQRELQETKKERTSVKRQLTKTKSQLTKTEAELDKARKDKERAEKQHKDYLKNRNSPAIGSASSVLLNPSPTIPRIARFNDENVSRPWGNASSYRIPPGESFPVARPSSVSTAGEMLNRVAKSKGYKSWIDMKERESREDRKG